MRTLLVFWLLAVSAFAGGPLRFEITIGNSVAPKATSGRMLVFMSSRAKKTDRLSTSFGPGDTWLAAMEFDHLEPGQTVKFDPDLKAYPHEFSSAPAGGYQFMALLDQDHSYARSNQDEGDLYSEVVRIKSMNPADADAVKLVLTRRTAAGRKYEDTENIKQAEFVSPSLSAFWGRPVTMRAGVVLPASFSKNKLRQYASSYHIHGFGGGFRAAWNEGDSLVDKMESGKRLEMVHIFLDANFPTGHHAFADSINNGPWSKALTEEFIPYLEKTWRLIPEARARFVTGHSSGGWSSLWLQVNYPDFFGGTWSTAPDPVDFRSFTGIDLSPGSTQNGYRTKDGKVLNLMRSHGREIASFGEFARQESVQGEYGGQLASFEWVFSPKAPDGRPAKLFDRQNGVIDAEVAQYWQRYDIRRILETNWDTLGPKLRGKLHIVVGAEDTFHLEEASQLLCDFLKSKGREDSCEIVKGRDHMNLYQPFKTYPDGLAQRIDDEMRAITVP